MDVFHWCVSVHKPASVLLLPYLWFVSGKEASGAGQWRRAVRPQNNSVETSGFSVHSIYCNVNGPNTAIRAPHCYCLDLVLPCAAVSSLDSVGLWKGSKQTLLDTSERKARAGLRARLRVRNVGLTERSSGLSPLIWSGRMNSDIKDLLVGASLPVEQTELPSSDPHITISGLISSLWRKKSISDYI